MKEISELIADEQYRPTSSEILAAFSPLRVPEHLYQL
jgi:hypothetical protein